MEHVTSLPWTPDTRALAYSAMTMFAREKSIMHVLESFPLDMRIDLGRGDGRMSEHGLD